MKRLESDSLRWDISAPVTTPYGVLGYTVSDFLAQFEWASYKRSSLGDEQL